jgi:hypothetical protein
MDDAYARVKPCYESADTTFGECKKLATDFSAGSTTICSAIDIDEEDFKCILCDDALVKTWCDTTSSVYSQIVSSAPTVKNTFDWVCKKAAENGWGRDQYHVCATNGVGDEFKVFTCALDLCSERNDDATSSAQTTQNTQEECEALANQDHACQIIEPLGGCDAITMDMVRNCTKDMGTDMKDDCGGTYSCTSDGAKYSSTVSYVNSLSEYEAEYYNFPAFETAFDWFNEANKNCCKTGDTFENIICLANYDDCVASKKTVATGCIDTADTWRNRCLNCDSERAAFIQDCLANHDTSGSSGSSNTCKNQEIATNENRLTQYITALSVYPYKVETSTQLQAYCIEGTCPS